MTLLERLAAAFGLGGPEDPDLLDLPDLFGVEAGDLLVSVGVRTDCEAPFARWHVYYQNRRDRSTTLELLFAPDGAPEVALEVPVAGREVGFAWIDAPLPRAREVLRWRVQGRAARTGGATVRRRRGQRLAWRGERDPFDANEHPLSSEDHRPRMNDPQPPSRGRLTLWAPEMSLEAARVRFLEAAAVCHAHVESMPPALRMDPTAWQPWRRWALALPALLDSPDASWPQPLYSGCPAGARANIELWWGVTDLGSGRSMLAGLLEGRHAPRFEAMRAEVRQLDPSSAARGDEQVRFVAGLGVVPHQGIRAWDIGRAVSLGQAIYTAGYMEEAETWDWIEEAARQAQASFGSWREWGRSWVLGEQFWRAGGQEPKPELEEWLERLLRRPLSAWSRAPWSDGKLIV